MVHSHVLLFLCDDRVMTLEGLFRNFTDEEFQYTRFLKTKNFDFEPLEKYSSLFESIKEFALTLHLNQEINEDLISIQPLDLAFSPRISLIIRIVGFLTFGISKKRVLRKKKSNYYLEELYRRHRLVQSIQLTLKHE